MPADAPGCLQVVVAGLRQLGTTCERLGRELSAAAGPSWAAGSPWQSTAATVEVACAAARQDLAVMAARLQASGTRYLRAADDFVATEDAGAAALGEVVR